MLTFTFRHFKGIGAKTERELWRSGVRSWQEFESRHAVQLSMFEMGAEDPEILDVWNSKKALDREDADYFAKSLPRQEHYRIALSFPLKTLFLDIETTGLSRYYDTITLVGWSTGREYNVFLKGDDPGPLRKALSEAKAIVTFNGSIFDLPFLRDEFPELKVPAAHVDLRFLAKRVGLVGGQKEVESTVGLERPGVLSSLRGEAAPLLWHRYRRGDLASLELLISYNRADIEGMKFILDTVVHQLLELGQFPKHVGEPHLFSGGYQALATEAQSSLNRVFVRDYKGSRGPLVTVKDLGVPSHRIVGIDLTGSETRPSGWCLLKDGKAATLRIGSDEGLIKATMRAQPSLISIDSPLSLPKGRITVDDDDPGRRLFGIMRECERILKKRGVNVYPSLINSMQALTARGIRLAAYFRSIGVPVIESYPGAAQDIMSIPRKGADIGLLKEGLAEFGISGEFKNRDVSHDELDAITSAVVGLFFMSGKFEGLGNEAEEYLIIPDIKSGTSPWGKRKVVGLSGPISSGKTTAGRYLASRGFAYGRYSEVLQALLEEKGVPVTRESLQQIGEEVHSGVGQRWLGSELIKRMPESGDLVIDGLRHPEDHSFLVEKFGPDFLHVHIDVNESVQRQRYTNEGSSEEFTKAAAHPIESNIPKLSELAHVCVKNEGTQDAFLSTIQEIVNSNFLNGGRIKCP
ncbi:MAG TPA: ribonuclease H-like domain-containing protein [Pyrinomonadaceae bacterium]|nr:ribonuclease H-like domain-containing protein [Pyrinomonadaceae bacterium]